MEKDTICSGNRNILLTCTHLRFHISTLGLINHTFGTQFVHMHAKHEKWKASQRDSNCFPRRHWNTTHTHTQCVHWWFRLDFHIARCVAINDIQSIYRYVFYFIHDSILKLKCETWKVLWAGKNVQIHTRARQTMRVEIAANTSGSMNKQIHASTRTSEMKSTAIYSLGLHEMRVDLLGLSKHSDELHFKTNNIMQMLRCSLFHLMKFQINTKNIQIIYTERKRERGDKCIWIYIGNCWIVKSYALRLRSGRRFDQNLFGVFSFVSFTRRENFHTNKSNLHNRNALHRSWL